MGINWRVLTKPLAFWLGIAGAAATPVLAYLGLGYEAIPRAWAARGATDPARTRSERKFGAGGPRRASTWQWLLRWGGHNNERLACVPWRLLQRLRLGTDAILRPHLLLELFTSVLCCGFLIRRHGLRGVFWLYRVNQRSAFRTLARSSPTSAR